MVAAVAGGSTTRSMALADRPFLSVMVIVTRSVFVNGAKTREAETVNGLAPVMVPTLKPVSFGE